MTEQVLSLSRDPGTGALTASFRSGPGAVVPNRQGMTDELARLGWAGAALDERALTDFFLKCREAQDKAEQAGSGSGPDAALPPDAEGRPVEAEGVAAAEPPPVAAEPPPAAAAAVPVEAQIGLVLDGGFKLAISTDKMSLWLDLWPAQGGRAVTADEIRDGAKRIGVGVALDEAALAAALEQGKAEGLAIAQGLPARQGTPAVFESLLDSLRPRFDEVDDDARVDFRKLGTLLIVSPGQALMRRVPAQQGWPGTNVLGQSIPVPRLPDAGYARGLTGVTFDEKDPNVLCAAIAGSPVVVHHGVNVSPVIEIDHVDLSTGNIEFDGALRVRGDVKSGMAVHVTGDVIVHGTVEAAEIQAGGNVTVEGGIIGDGQDSAPDGQPGGGRVACKGTVQSRFINHARVSAGGDVIVEREILNSEVLAGGRITVGSPGATRGGIAGGRCCAMTLVRAPRLGTPGGVVTHIQVGLDPHADSRRAELEAARKKLKEERAKIEQLVNFLKANPAKAVDGIGERSQSTYLKILEELAALDTEEALVTRNMMRIEGVAIEAGQRLCNGVTLQVANRRMEMMDDFGRSRAIWHEGEVVVNSH